MRALLLIALAGLMQAARSFAPLPDTGSGAAGTALAFGFLLLVGFLFGDLCESMRLPRLTGYITAGILAGPSVLNLISGSMAANLSIFNGVAIALIALTAGVELDLRAMQPLYRSIAWIIIVAIFGTTILLSIAGIVARPWLPFLNGLSRPQVIAAAVVLGVTMVAQSPAVVVALRAELRADGPLTRTVLGVVVMSDLVVVLLFAIVSSIAKGLFGAQADALQTARSLAWELLGSIAIGVVIGAIVSAYLKYVRASGELFLIVVGFIVAEVGQRIELDPLILALAAGLYIRNVTGLGHILMNAVEAASLPVYVVFFAVTGANLRLKDVVLVWPAALIFVLVRASGFLGGTYLGAKIAGSTDSVRKFAAFGLIPQAGLALALTLLMARTFPTFGADASTVVFASVAINQIVAPVLFRWVLVRTGEANSSGAAVTTA
ncbi:MAG: cation:proton antiporter [Acidobacteriaceae bacterium]|nr:cation:proton antiporter [Acidobacteriaceae bacterium]